MNNEKYIFRISRDDICNCKDENTLDNFISKIKENEENNIDNSFNHYHMYDQCQNRCDVCRKIYMLVNNMEVSNEDYEKGGKKKQKRKPEKEIDFLEKPSYFNIQNIDTSKIERLGKKAIYDLINQNILLSANTLSKDIIETILRNYSTDINNFEYDALVKYIEDNTPYVLKQQILKTHPYFSLSNLNKIVLDKQMELLEVIYKSHSYQTCNFNSRIVSKQYKNLSSLDSGFIRDVVSFGNNNDFIEPVIFCLFANKLTFLDDLINNVDPLTVLTDMIVNKKITEENKFRMFLKASDPTDFITGDTKIINGEVRLKHELYRLIYHNMLKMIVLNLRQGKWYSQLSGELSKITNKIGFRSYKTEEEKILSTVLSCVPFKPILVTKTTDPISSVPESVEFVEFDIMRNRLGSIKESLKLDSSVFNNISYDSLTKRLCIVRKSIVKEEKNCAYLGEIGNLGPFLGNKLSFDMFRNINNNSVLFANGVFFISIPRIHKKSLSRFYNSGAKNIVLDDPIDIPDDPTIGGEVFSLIGAVCCKTLENSGIYEMCSSKEYIGRYSYNKIDDDTWIKYDPFAMSVPYMKNKIIEDSLRKLFREQNVEIENFVIDNDTPYAIKEKIKNISNDKFSIKDFLYNGGHVKDDISRYATLLVYNNAGFENIICDVY